MTSDLNFAVALLTIRIIAGVLFLFQGYDKIFNIGYTEIRQTMKAGFGNKHFPDALISVMASFSSWVELLCGILLILGFMKYYAIYLLCLDLMIVVLGHSLTKPMWENNQIYIRLALLLILLVTPVEWDRISIDYLYALTKLTV